MSFEKLGVFKPLLDAINDLGYTEPTIIQQRAIPLVLQKKDLFATAQTGTGKTAAFALPLLQKLRKKDTSKGVRAVIVSPTRELSVQIYEDITAYSKYMDIKCEAIISGKDIVKQIAKLKGGAEVIVATPGRLLELTQNGLKLDDVEVFVLDEADRMLDMGFSKDIKAIHPLLPKRHQTLLFSATFSEKVRKLSKLILTSPAFIETAKKNTTVDTINQVAYLVDANRKAELLAYLIGSRNYPQVLVFTRTKASADILGEELEKDGLKTGVIHGDKTKANRLKTLKQFMEGKFRVLVATDIASRGLDIEELPYVINYELPSIPEDYVHRVGRTGRAGREGEAISLLDVYEKYEIRDIEKLIGQKIDKETVEGFEPDPNIRRKDIDEVKLKSEHKKQEKRFVKTKKEAVKTTATSLKRAKKRKTTKRDPR
ncbi:DEAD/DEAH box helicase [Sulfurimonas marina]|uniref:DEAD/DEAH box helicase n=1 Tax=Sulfurimonas marina TaxID=2590551 RepID=A0A7M1ATX0_9BACT|nr:DEAD/DEAH box helicase [Sulfurimonas marina]QOP40840.1 DEAD/DEAH box helicase [Sulfurimonas marina]